MTPRPVIVLPKIRCMIFIIHFCFQVSIYATSPNIAPKPSATIPNTPQSINITVNTTERAVCVHNRQWFPLPSRQWTPSIDCVLAVTELRREPWFSDISDTIEVFDDRSRSSTAPFYKLKTPAQWTSAQGGTCTLTVAMLNHYDPYEIPEIAGSGAGVDIMDTVSNYELLDAMSRLFKNCAIGQQAGWTYVGQKDSIGVFLWATGSHIDRETRNVVSVSLNVTASVKDAVNVPKVLHEASVESS